MKFSMLALLGMATLALATCGQKPTAYRDANGASACKTPDCAGHEAGWRWARAHRIDDPDQCGGRSRSFIEGCRAYAGSK